MGTNECSQLASKSSWDSQDFGDVNIVLKWPIFTSPPGHNELINWHKFALITHYANTDKFYLFGFIYFNWYNMII